MSDAPYTPPPPDPRLAPPDPWRPSTMPDPRSGPPYLMTEMIEAESAVALRVLARLAIDPAVDALAAAIAGARAARNPIRVVGCGTSEHGAIGFTAILQEALGDDGRLTSSEDSLEASLQGGSAGVLIAISHEGGTSATNRAIEVAADSGSTTAIVTATSKSPGAALATITLATGEQDASWCHTIGYLSPILAAAVVAGRISGWPVEAERIADALTVRDAWVRQVEGIAGAVGRLDRLLVVGSGADAGPSRELALKLEEAAYLPAAMHPLETLLHGHLAACDPRTGLVLVATDRRAANVRLARARQALEAVREIGMACGAILSEDADAALPADLTPAGRVVVADDGGLPASLRAAVGTCVPLQLLTERIARVRGTDPDTLRRTDPRYLAAAARAEG